VAVVLAAASAHAAEEIIKYTYDEAGRLVMAAYGSGGSNAVIRYGYDPNGNRTNRTAYGTSDSTDSDGDSFDDVDELFYFGDLDEDLADDSDGDGLVNSNELAMAGDPSMTDTDSDGLDDGDEAIAGTLLNDSEDVFDVANVGVAPSGEARIWWNVVSGRSYRLQMRAELMSGTWIDVGTQHDSTSNGVYSVDEAFDPNAFFRVKVWVTP